MPSGSCSTLLLHFAGAPPTSRSRETQITHAAEILEYLFPCAARLCYRLNHKKGKKKETENALKALVIPKCAGFLLKRPVKVSPSCVWIVDAGRGSGTKRIADQLRLDSTRIQQSTKSLNSLACTSTGVRGTFHLASYTLRRNCA